MLTKVGIITVAASFIYLIGIPYLPTLIKLFKLFMCFRTSVSPVGRKNNELLQFWMRDVVVKLQFVEAEILLCNETTTLTKQLLNALLIDLVQKGSKQ